MRYFTIIGALLFFSFGCVDSKMNYSERIIHSNGEEYKYISRSYPDKKLDSIWKYHIDGHLVSVYTGDSLGRCFGWVSGYRQTGELHYNGQCWWGKSEGRWTFYDKSGELIFINLYSNGHLYQRKFPESRDTAKWLYPIIEIEPQVAHVFDTIYVRADYILDGIDTTGWDYYLHFDFIEMERFDNRDTLPYEEIIEKYMGEQIEKRIKVTMPGEYVMYGYTLAVNRETGDSTYHLDIMDKFLTIIDTTSVE